MGKASCIILASRPGPDCGPGGPHYPGKRVTKAGVLWRRTATFSRICESDRLDRSATGAFESSPERVRRAGGHSRNLDAGSRFRNPQSPAIFLYSRTAGRSRAHVARESVGDAGARPLYPAGICAPTVPLFPCDHWRTGADHGCRSGPRLGDCILLRTLHGGAGLGPDGPVARRIGYTGCANR
jgi:hypothetical protein